MTEFPRRTTVEPEQPARTVGPFFAELQWDDWIELERGNRTLRGFGKNLDAATAGELRDLIAPYRARYGTALNVVVYEVVDGRRKHLDERGHPVDGARAAREALRGNR